MLQSPLNNGCWSMLSVTVLSLAGGGERLCEIYGSPWSHCQLLGSCLAVDWQKSPSLRADGVSCKEGLRKVWGSLLDGIGAEAHLSQQQQPSRSLIQQLHFDCIRTNHIIGAVTATARHTTQLEHLHICKPHRPSQHSASPHTAAGPGLHPGR